MILFKPAIHYFDVASRTITLIAGYCADFVEVRIV